MEVEKISPPHFVEGKEAQDSAPPWMVLYVFRIVSFLGKFVKQVICKNTWNAYIEKALEFMPTILKLCSILKQSFKIIYAIVVNLDRTFFNEYNFMFWLLKKTIQKSFFLPKIFCE